MLAVLFLAKPTLYSTLIGIVIGLLGMVIRIFASGYKLSDKRLLVDGPYRVVRNPHLLGSSIVALGLVVASRNIYVSCFVVVFLMFVYREIINLEEKKLRELWGPAYTKIKVHIAGFIPQLIPATTKTTGSQSFSFRQALMKEPHKEMNAFLVVALAFGILYGKVYIEEDLYYFAGVGAVFFLSVLFRLIFVRRRSH